MQSTPKGRKESYFKIYENSDIIRITPSDNCQELCDIAMKCGLYMNSGMGISTITWGEIMAWQEVTGFFSIWVAESIMLLSKSFCRAYAEYNGEPYSLSPLDPRTEDLLREQRG